MNKKEAAQQAFTQSLDSAGAAGMYALDLLKAAHELQIPVDPPRLRQVGNRALGFLGIKPGPYRPNFTGLLYPTLARLERTGVVESEWEAKPATPGAHPRRIYRIARPADEGPYLDPLRHDPGEGGSFA